MNQTAIEDPFLNDAFEVLHIRYPALHQAIVTHFHPGDIVRREAIPAGPPGALSLSPGLLRLFEAVTHLKMRGLELSFARMLLRTDGYIKIGELALDDNGDELLVMPGQNGVYYHSIRHGVIRLLSPDVEEFVERVLGPFIARPH